MNKIVSFKRPYNVDHFIDLWEKMDCIIDDTKKGDPLKFWRKFGTPMGIPYDDVHKNPYHYRSEFRNELNRMYDRIYHIFTIAMGIKIYTRKVKKNDTSHTKSE